MANYIDSIDDYITDRLSRGERKAFEKKMDENPSLKSDVQSEQFIADQIKTYRANQLKTMLQQVPLSATTVGSGLTVATKAIIGIAGAGIVIGALYFMSDYSTTNDVSSEQQMSTEEPIKSIPSKESGQENIDAASINENNEKQIILEENPTDINQDKPIGSSMLNAVEKPAITQQSTPKTPVLVIPEFDGEQQKDDMDAVQGNDKPKPINNSSLYITVKPENKKNTYEYLLVDNELILYGNFEEQLYEILEINGEQSSYFLYYKKKYHWLNPEHKEITKIVPIDDEPLIEKLEQYRKHQ